MDLNDEYLKKIKQLNEIMDLLKTAVEVEAICKYQVQKILSDLKNINLETDTGNHKFVTDAVFQIISDRQGRA